MRESKILLWLVGVICGFEIIIAATLGGAGVGAVFGLDGALVLASIAMGVAFGLRRVIAVRKKTIAR